MLNSDLKKEWLSKLKDAQENYKSEAESIVPYCESLHKVRTQGFVTIKNIEALINSIANKPKTIVDSVAKIEITLHDFSEYVNLQQQSDYDVKVTGSAAVIGATSISVAAFGSSTAMAIATTFGTASTGTAIASLSGAAASNAALAWLGGGTLAAGGSGMAGGSALLATISGPIGWTIGGVALIGGGLLANSRNKKIAEEAEEKVYAIEEEINKLRKIKVDVIQTTKLNTETNNAIEKQFSILYKKVTKKSLFGKESFLSKLFKFKYALVCTLISWPIGLLFIAKQADYSVIGMFFMVYAMFGLCVQLPIGVVRSTISRFRNDRMNKLSVLSTNEKIDYNSLSDDIKLELGSLINNAQSVATLINKEFE